MLFFGIGGKESPPSMKGSRLVQCFLAYRVTHYPLDVEKQALESIQEEMDGVISGPGAGCTLPGIPPGSYGSTLTSKASILCATNAQLFKHRKRPLLHTQGLKLAGLRGGSLEHRVLLLP